MLGKRYQIIIVMFNRDENVSMYPFCQECACYTCADVGNCQCQDCEDCNKTSPHTHPECDAYRQRTDVDD